MALLNPGYWPSTYYPSSYWSEDFWPKYGAITFSSAWLLLGKKAKAMQQATIGSANIVYWDAVLRASGGPITSGTVTGYLQAITGDNATKWFRASDSTWQAAEASAGEMTHVSDGHWKLSIVAGAWESGVKYSFYAKENGDLHIPYSEQVVAGHIEPEIGKIEFTYTLTEAGGGDPIEGATVGVYTDSAMTNLVDRGTTDNFGKVTYQLDAGTYYLKRVKSGVTFTNPDTEVVS